jgi:hypothetical protein
MGICLIELIVFLATAARQQSTDIDECYKLMSE